MTDARPPIPAPIPATAVPAHPAPLLHRWAAWSLDASLVAAVSLALVATPLAARVGVLDTALAALLDAMLQPMLATLPGLPTPAQLLADDAIRVTVSQLASALGSVLLPLAPFVPLFWLYASAFECRHAATPGKRALRLRVVDAQRVGPVRCRRHALRQAAGLLSWLSLNLGHLMAALPPRHQALHDRIAGLRVMAETDAARLPRWAQAWLWLQAALVCAALAISIVALQARVDAALVRALG